MMMEYVQAVAAGGALEKGRNYWVPLFFVAILVLCGISGQT